MTAAQAKLVERLIIGLCVASVLAIFQPFSLTLFGIGCVTVVIGALAFNLVPFCREGVPFSKLVRVSTIILVILVAAAALGIGAALLYVGYIASLQA